MLSEWLSFFGTLITAGAFVTVYLVGEKKTSAVLDNVQKSNDQWQELTRTLKEDVAALKAEAREKDDRISSLFKEQCVLRDRNDKLSSQVTALSIYRCRDTSCVNRIPPFGTKRSADEEATAVVSDK